MGIALLNTKPQNAMLIEADFSAAELRVVAALAGDKPWLDAFAQGASPHMHTCRHVLMLGECDKASEEYRFAKSANFRWIYTMPDAPLDIEGGKLRTTRVKVDPQALALMAARMANAHPAIMAWKRRSLQALRTTYEVRDPFGNRRNLKWAFLFQSAKLEAHACNAALNFPIQSAIGHLINRAIIALEQCLPVGAQLIGQKHDSVLVEAANDSLLPAVVRAMTAVMERPIAELNQMVIPIEIKYGPNWGEMRAYASVAR